MGLARARNMQAQVDLYRRLWILRLHDPLRDHTLLQEPTPLKDVVNAAKTMDNMVNLKRRGDAVPTFGSSKIHTTAGPQGQMKQV